MSSLRRRSWGVHWLSVIYLLGLSAPSVILAEDLEAIAGVERQPLVAQAERIIEVMEEIGAPLSAEDVVALKSAMAEADAAESTLAIQRILNPYCLIGVQITPESRVKVVKGPAEAELAEQGWRGFLVRVHNEPGVTSQLKVESRNSQRVARQFAQRVARQFGVRRWPPAGGGEWPGRVRLGAAARRGKVRGSVRLRRQVLVSARGGDATRETCFGQTRRSARVGD